MNRRQTNGRQESAGRKLADVLLTGDGGVISLVGAGGKTSLMFRLAGEASNVGQPVITSTTTRILMPTKNQSPALFLANNAAGLLEKLAHSPKIYQHVTVASKKSPDGNKLVGLSPGEIDALGHSNKVPWIIVEADGASRKPLKAPAGHEPVIPLTSTVVVGVIGLKAIGKPLTEKWVFRSVLFAERAGLSLNDPVTVDAVVKLINHPQGLFKGAPAGARRLIFLNLAGDDRLLNCGLALVERLKRQPILQESSGVIIGNGRDDPGLVDYHLFF